MKERIKKWKTSCDGFTLGELLIVVAIIAVLIVISIPIFTGQLEKARNATDIDNAKACVHAVTYYYLANPEEYGKLQAECDKVGGKHFVRMSVDKNMAVTTEYFAKPLKDAQLIDAVKSDGRYPEIQCKSKKNWNGFYIIATTYQTKSGEIEFYYRGRASSSSEAITADHNIGFFTTDPTDFNKMVRGRD